MAYIKLGNTQINYGTEGTIDSHIFSQIVDSRSSYSSPKLIRTTQELETYFGNSYKDYDYHRELISSGATLYLYKPIHDDITLKSDIEGWVNLESFTKFCLISKDSSGEYIFPSNIPDRFYDIESGRPIDINKYLSGIEEDKREAELTNYRSSVIFSSVLELPEKGKVIGDNTLYSFTVFSDGVASEYYYDENLEDFVNISELPQSLKPSEYNTGKLNRDTLRLNSLNWASRLEDIGSDTPTSYPRFDMCFPRYSTASYVPSYPDISEYIDTPSKRKQLITSIQDNQDFYKDDYYSLAYTFDFSKVTKIVRGDYIVFLDPISQQGSIFYFSENENTVEQDAPPIGDNEVGGAQKYSVPIYLEGEGRDKSIEELVEELIKMITEKVKNENGSSSYRTNWRCQSSDGLVYHLWNINGITRNSQFFSIENLEITPDVSLTQDILSVVSEDFKRAEFYSKTIGPGDDNIKIKIEKVKTYNPERYKITVSRYTYSEVFEGNLYLDEDYDGRVESLENIINQNSNLIECKIFKKTKRREYYSPRLDKRLDNLVESYKRENIDDGLPEGEWILGRAKSEEYTSNDYLTSLMEMKTELRIKEDFILISNLEYLNLNDIYDYTLAKNCQALVVNHKLDYLGNILLNNVGLSKDLSNRLIFFLGDMKYKGNDRPGYYVFLDGVLTGDFLKPRRDLYYESKYYVYDPESEDNMKEMEIEDAYLDYPKILEKYKVNYLVFNEHYYYYRQLFSHSGDYRYNMSILSKYCQSYVTRVAEREFPQFFGYDYSGDIMEGIQSILNFIMINNILIKNLKIDYVLEDSINQTIEVSLLFGVRESAEKDISLGVNLNFNLI